MRTRWIDAIVLGLLGACGGDGTDPATAGTAGTYELDVADWRKRAEEEAGPIRFQDALNKDRLPGVPESPFTGYLPGDKWDALTAEQRAEYDAKARAYVAGEVAELSERLVLLPTGTFDLVHRSRGSEGGSVGLGLLRSNTLKGTWSREKDELRLNVEQATVPGGPTWKVGMTLKASVEADGSFHVEGGRGRLREQVSVFRRKAP
jgi:hypothetical protein